MASRDAWEARQAIAATVPASGDGDLTTPATPQARSSPVLPDDEASSQRLAEDGRHAVAADAARTSGHVKRGNTDEGGIRAELIGRCTLHERLDAGGMASVYIGSLAGAAHFSRIVAIKRMHPQFAADDEFVARFRDEAWLSARLLHPNIVQTFDVIDHDGELLLVMEYVDGVTLKTLSTDASAVGSQLPLDVSAGILVPVLHGLNAAHEATDDEGHPLGIVHRDFSPQNIIVGRDGHAKILDFGVAKARTHQHVTSVGSVTGKFAYLSPEQFLGTAVDRRADVFAAGIVLWEMLTGRRLFYENGFTEATTVERVLRMAVTPPSHVNPAVPARLDEIVLHALERDPARRFVTARQFALQLEQAVAPATPTTVAAYVALVSSHRLEQLARVLARSRRCSVKTATVLADFAEAPTLVSAPPGSALEPAPSSPPPARATLAGGWRIAAALADVVVLVGLVACMVASFVHRGSSEQALRSLAPTGPSAQAGLGASGRYEPKQRLRRAPPAAQSVQPRTAPTTPDSKARVSSSAKKPDTRSAERTVAPHRGRRSSTSASAPPGAATTVPRRPEATGPASEPNCEPPTYLDAQGIRHFKSGCI